MAFKIIIINLIRLFFWGVLRKLLVLLPLRSIPFIEAMIADFLFFLSTSKKAIIRTALLKSYSGKKSIEKIERDVKEGFRVYTGSNLRNLFLSRLTPSNIEKCIPVEGLEHLEVSMRKGRGVIVLNPHFGPYFLMIPALGHRGYKVNQIALHGLPHCKRTWTDDVMERMWIEDVVERIKFKNIQGKMPATFINAAEMSNIRKGVEALKRNEIVLFPVTGRGGLDWIEVTFMNRKALFNTGPFKLAQRTGASILPALVFSDGKLGNVVIERPLEVQDREMQEIVQEYADLLSRQVELRPSHFSYCLYINAVNASWDKHPLFKDDGIEKQ